MESGVGFIFKQAGCRAQPTFSITRNFAGDSTPGLHELEEHEMVYSYDGENWSFFDNNNLGATNFTFSNSALVSQSQVYVAYAIPYSYGRSVVHTQAVLASPWAAPTVSGNASGIIGQSPVRTDDLGRSVPCARSVRLSHHGPRHRFGESQTENRHFERLARGRDACSVHLRGTSRLAHF